VSTVLVDTSAWIGILNRKDGRHAESLGRYQELSRAGARLVTSNYVIDETATHLRYEAGLRAALAFRETLVSATGKGHLRIGWIDEKLEREGWRILEQYSDVKLSLTDATSVALARSAKIVEVFGLDADFEALGFVVLPGRRVSR